MRVIPRLRDVVAELGMVPVPGFVTVPEAASAFTEQGRLVDRQTEDAILGLVRRLMTTSRRR